MGKGTNCARRSFLKRGAMFAAPLAMGAPAVALAGDDGTKARLQRLEDEAAIGELHQSWLRKVNAGERGVALGEAVRRIVPDHAGEPDAVDLAANGTSARARYHCVVSIEEALAKDSTLAQMARAQGTGFVSRTERRLLEVDYVKTGGAWTIEQVELV